MPIFLFHSKVIIVKNSFFVVLSTTWLVISEIIIFYGSMFNVISHISCNNAANFFIGEMIKNLSDYG